MAIVCSFTRPDGGSARDHRWATGRSLTRLADPELADTEV
jgi:hypothetical protein